MRIKKKKTTKCNFIGFRVSDKELNDLKLKSNLYTEGNLSEWLLYSGLNYSPKKDELEER